MLAESGVHLRQLCTLLEGKWDFDQVVQSPLCAKAFTQLQVQDLLDELNLPAGARDEVAEALTSSSILFGLLNKWENDGTLPIHSTRIDKVGKTRRQKKEDNPADKVWRTVDSLGWSPPRYADYQRFLGKLYGAEPNLPDVATFGSPGQVVLVNDGGWGFSDVYFSDRNGHQRYRDFLVTEKNCDVGQDDWLVLHARAFPPYEWQPTDPDGKPEASSMKDRSEVAQYWQTLDLVTIDPKLVVVTGISDLRAVGVDVSYGISWERTLQNILEAAEKDFDRAAGLPGILEARFVVISFGADGLAIVDRDTDAPTDPISLNDPARKRRVSVTLGFHPPAIESDTYRRSEGLVFALSTWVSTLLAVGLSVADPAKKALDLSTSGDKELFAELSHCFMRSSFLRGVKVGPKSEIETKMPAEMQFGQSRGEEHFVDWFTSLRCAIPYKHLTPGAGVAAVTTGNLDASLHILDLLGCPDDSEIQVSAGYSIRFSELRQFLLRTWNIRSLQIFSEDFRFGSNRPPNTDPDSGHRFSRTWWTLQSHLICQKVWKSARTAGGIRPAQVSKRDVVERYLRYAIDVLVYGGAGNDEYFPDGILAPYARFGSYVTSDREEIESYRNLAETVQEYLLEEGKRPLNLVVFGPPGSGKSFGVKELMNSLEHHKEVVFHTFNLSQFSSSDALPMCFQVVQDEVLAGKLPVVFWDEFDTTLNEVPFGWLQAFLAPMQDGSYVYNNRVNPLGQCIFVFAGSRFNSFSDLPEPQQAVARPRERVITIPLSEIDRDTDTGEATDMDRMRTERLNLLRRQEHWRVAKGNDFRSRIKGRLDIKEPNLPEGSWHIPDDQVTLQQSYLFSPLSFLVRRARLIRSLLQENHRQLFVERDVWFPDDGRVVEQDPLTQTPPRRVRVLKISREVVFGLLSPYRFKHGTRSIESVLHTSALHGKARFDRSALAPEDILSIHINPHAFELDENGSSDEQLFDEWYRVFERLTGPREDPVALQQE